MPFAYRQYIPEPPKIGRPKRDRAKIKAARRAGRMKG